MTIKRRDFLNASAAGIAAGAMVAPTSANAAPLPSALGRDATQYGVRPNSPDDQTRVLQRAIDEAAKAQAPLALPPGSYRTGTLRLLNGAQLTGIRGATKFVSTGAASILTAQGANGISISGLTLDGRGIRLPEG